MVKQLLYFGAAMMENDLHMTPLAMAAECGKEEIVRYLIKQPDCSRVGTIDVLP